MHEVHKKNIEQTLIERHSKKVYEKLRKASVTIAGLGGLGSHIAVSLSRMGVGHLYVIDFDEVEYSNLNRQYYFLEHLGKKKTEAIKDIITRINPLVEVESKTVYINEDNVEQVFLNRPLVVEAFDNPVSKALLVNHLLAKKEKNYIVAASGMAGYYSSNTIRTRKVREGFYMIGDGVSEISDTVSLMSPRVAIAAHHQANMVIRLILGEEEA